VVHAIAMCGPPQQATPILRPTGWDLIST